MKKALCYLLLIVVISFLNPDYVWGLLIRKFPPEWYEYCCIGAVVTAWLISLGLVVVVFRRLRSQKNIVRYFFTGVLVGILACSTARFCREVNQHFTVAVLHGNLITADILLHLGADINATDSADGLTPLQSVRTICLSPEAGTAFEPHRQALADWLISRGAIHTMGKELESRNRYGRTPLMELVGKHETTVADVRHLLDAGADIKARDNKGNTVLMHAVGIRWYSHEMPMTLDVVKYLVERGVDVFARNHQGMNALEVAMCHRECNEKVLSWLLSLGLTASPGAELAMEAGHDDVDGVRQMLAAGADPNFNNAMALWLSLSAGTHGQQNEEENVRQLLAAGADPNLCAGDILKCACHGAGMEAIALILEHGVDFSKVDTDAASYDLATLWLAREEGWPKPLFMQLVNHGARVNGSCGYGEPLLCYVVADPQQGPREVDYLLSVGAEPTLKNKDGKTALDLARELNRTELIPLLEKALNK